MALGLRWVAPLLDCPPVNSLLSTFYFLGTLRAVGHEIIPQDLNELTLGLN